MSAASLPPGAYVMLYGREVPWKLQAIKSDGKVLLGRRRGLLYAYVKSSNDFVCVVPSALVADQVEDYGLILARTPITFSHKDGEWFVHSNDEAICM